MSRVGAVGSVVVNETARVIGWVKRDRRVSLGSKPAVKVNLGCGLQVAPEWVNVDGSPNALIAQGPAWLYPLAYHLSGAKAYYPADYYVSTLRDHTFVYHNLEYGIPLEGDTADFVYTSHFLEHLDRSVGRTLLSECLRVLKPGGVLRVVVPDLEVAWEMYRHGDKERMIHDFFFAEEVSGFGNHRYAYDFEMLSGVLDSLGFTDVEQKRYREGATPDLELLDNREDYSLFVEAVKPGRAGTGSLTVPEPGSG